MNSKMINQSRKGSVPFSVVASLCATMVHSSKKNSQLTRLVCLAIFVFMGLTIWTGPAWAALSVEIVNGYNLVVDSNVTAPPTYAPKSAYIGARICNTGDTAIDDVVAYVGDYIDGSNDTPGYFPVLDSAAQSAAWDTAHPHIVDTGKYSLTIEADETGAADGTRYIGTLEPGECRMQYWLFSYPQCVNVDADGDGVYESNSDDPPCEVSITGGIKPEDDLVLDYDVWATTSTSGVSTAVETRDFTMRNEISASANKIWPNTDSKVPNEYLEAIESVIGWGTLGPDGQPLSTGNPIYPGQRVITTQGIWYDLGNVVHGFDNDNDLIVDQNAWLQPVGDPGLFDADCFRMVRNYGIVIVKLKSGGEALIPFEDQLYFMNLPDNTGVVGLVYYQFIATDEGCSADMTPYQEAASGYDNEKFSSDYGLGLQLYSGSFGTALSLTKTDGRASANAGDTLTYTITATNDSGVHLGAPDLGVPLVFEDFIPTGTTYVPGSADDSPDTNLIEPTGTGSYTQGYTDRDDNLDECTINYEVPLGGSSYEIFYFSTAAATWDETDITWSDTEPPTPSDVKGIRWMLITDINLDGSHDGDDCVAPNGTYDDGSIETSLPAGMSTTINFQVTVNSNGGPIICNTTGLGFGEASSAVEAEDCTLVTGDNTLSGTVFKDDGGGDGGAGIYGNGTQENGIEAGIGDASDGVKVTLYYDLNGDGEYDSGDIQYDFATADTNGDYSFTNLPDGPFLVVAKKYDGSPAPGDSTDNAVNDFNAGWGNTTSDPNLPTTTDQGILKMSEDSTTVTLSVNIDLDNSDSTPQAISNVNFGFAPPLELTKGISGNPDIDGDVKADNPIDEGDVFDYSITLANRLPSVGVQGPTGCEYTIWSTSGSTGLNPKDFATPENAYDSSSPNRTTASALVSGGGLRWMLFDDFAMSQRPGNISKVEGLFFGYFDTTLTDDFLDMEIRYPGETDVTATISTAQIESYVGEPSLDINNAISWDISTLKPGGTGVVGDWASDFSDFESTDLYINPSKTASADQKTFYLDAAGLRVTMDVDCAAGESTTLSPVPLQDTYDTTRFEFISADPAPTLVNTSTGVIQWDDVGPILPGTSTTVIVTMRALDVDGTITGTCSGTPDGCNFARTDYGTMNVYYADGRQANDDNDNIAVDIVGKAEIRGTAWNDTSNDGWPDNDGEAGLPFVAVSLYACVQADGSTLETGSAKKTCEEMTNGNFWGTIATTTTDANGDYEFLGLDSGYYIVEVGDTDSAPASGPGGNSSPFSGTQTAEPDDDQSITSADADAPNQTTFNNTWGDPGVDFEDNQGNLNLNFLNGVTEETVNGVDFGYYIPTATIYGNVWHDVDGDTVTDGGDNGLPGFTVKLYDDTDADGDPDGAAVDTVTTGANGNYFFSGLSAGDYVVVVTPPTLLSQVWEETVENTGGTTSLNNQIPVTGLSAGEFSGSHNFGYTLDKTAIIGDTVYIDFDADGIQDATEDPIANITVWLYNDEDRDGTIDTGVDALIATDVTDVNGNYLFEGLGRGSYVVVVDTNDTDFPTNTFETADPDTNAASIGDLIFLDADGDGNLDAGEEGIPNVVVLLYEDTNGNGILDTAADQIIGANATDVNGNYLFTALNAGDYFVDVDETSLPASDLSITTTDPAATLISLSDRTISTSVLTADAGYSPSSGYAIGNRVWSDANGDGVQDAGEAGISDVDISITGTGCAPCNATTDESGYWIVTGLTNLAVYSVVVDTEDVSSTFAITTPGGDTQSKTISTADDMSADFGFRYDGDGDGVADEDAGDPTGAITGNVFLDSDGDETLDSGEEMIGVTVNLFDSDGNLIATTLTDASGTYTFTGVPIGQYAVQSVDATGTQYSTIFLAAGEAFTDLDVIYNALSLNLPDSQSSVSVGGVYANLMQDFGYQRFLGAIGDTIYLDVNANADQDLGEPGLDGVSVYLYLWDDLDSDGVVDDADGELTLEATAVTTADNPLTAEDESGKYLFSNLDEPPTGQYYVVQVNTASLPGTGFTLIGDPDTDGVPCTDSSAPDGCDSLQVVDGYSAGINYLGADFGYQIDGADYAAIGDYVWIDTDADGVIDSGEAGIRYITVYFDADNDGSLDWTDGNGNGTWDSGEGEQWVETDTNGYYVFTELADGTYNYLKVDTNDSDWPSGLPTIPVYEVRSDNDGSLDSSANVVISGGNVTSIVDGDGDTTDTCMACNLDIDFGYRYSGTNTLSGTICLDDPSLNGYCGSTATTYSGVDSAGGEAPLAGITASFYQWTDTDNDNQAWAVDGTLDSGDSFTFLGSTSSDANGDYSYDNLPDDVIVVFSVSETYSLDLTTTNGNTSVEGDGLNSYQLYEGTTIYDFATVTIFGRQALKDLDLDADNNIKDLDFAFEGLISYDFGDLPDSGATDYNATLLTSGGARHVVAGSSIYLGTAAAGDGVSTENDGRDSSDASADSNDDGVTLFSSNWNTSGYASVTVEASADGWVAGWMDFNGDGDFSDAEERIVNQAVTAGDNLVSFSVPDIAGGTYQFNARFRIYPEEPVLVSYTGTALNSSLQPTTGEVEDYQWTAVVTYASVASFTSYESNGNVILEWETSTQIGTLGFHVVRLEAEGKTVQVTDHPVPALVFPNGGVYQCIDRSAESGGTYTYQLVELEASGRKRTYGPYTVSVGTRSKALDQEAYASLFRDGYSRQPREMFSQQSQPVAVMEASTEQLTADAWKVSRAASGFNVASRTLMAAEPQESLAGVREVKIKITDAGLYKVDAGALATALNVFEDDVLDVIAKGQLRLSSLGKPVAYFPAEDNSSIYFYGQSRPSIYTDSNVYWLKLIPGSEKGDLNGDGVVDNQDFVICMDILTGKPGQDLRADYETSGADVSGNARVDMAEAAYIQDVLLGIMGSVTGNTPSEAGEGKSFASTVHFEKEVYFKTDLPVDVEDFWFWEKYTLGVPDYGSWPEYYPDFNPFQIDVGEVMPGSSHIAELTVHFHGFSNHPHQAKVTLNFGAAGELYLGEVSWSGYEPVSKIFSFNQQQLAEGINTIKVESLKTDDAFGVDSFDLTYQRLYIASEDSLHFHSGENDVIAVGGFTGSDIFLFDLTNPNRPKRVSNAAIDTVNNLVTLMPDTSETPYLALRLSAAKVPASEDIIADEPSDLKNDANAAAYLIITADELSAGAMALEAYRMDKFAGSTKVVKLSDIFDEFSHGIYDPYAIKKFIVHAKNNWAKPPQYVVLVGHGTYNYKRYLEKFNTEYFGNPFYDTINLLPVIMTSTPFGKYASDNLYGDVNGDGMLDLAIGRIPAKTDAEVLAYVIKLKSYEKGLDPGNNHVMMLADNPDPGPFNNFPADSDDVIAQFLGDYSFGTIYYPGKTKDEMNSAFAAGVKDGAWLVNYIGHGGYDVMSNFYENSYVGSLENTQYPIYVALTCLAGDFSFPLFDSLSETLVLKSNGGMIAACSPTGLSVNSEAVKMNKKLFEAFFEEQDMGGAVKRAIALYKADGDLPFPYMIDVYNLLGDPALEIKQ